MANRAVDWSESLQDLCPRLGGAVGDGNEDNIPLVTLDILKIFDEEGFECLFPVLAVGSGLGAMCNHAVNLVLDEFPLGLVEGNYTERPFRVLLHKADCRLSNRAS